MEFECFENRVYLINSYMMIYHVIVVEPYIFRHELFFMVRKGGGAGIFIYFSFENDTVPCPAKVLCFNILGFVAKYSYLRLTHESMQINWAIL